MSSTTYESPEQQQQAQELLADEVATYAAYVKRYAEAFAKLVMKNVEASTLYDIQLPDGVDTDEWFTQFKEACYAAEWAWDECDKLLNDWPTNFKGAARSRDGLRKQLDATPPASSET